VTSTPPQALSPAWSRGIGGHHRGYRGATDEWLTPPRILRALGAFDLDPCAPLTRPWATAARHYTIRDNGLLLPWSGRVWLNPPYGPQTGKWLAKLAHHGNGIALIFARTETTMFHEHGWNKADAMLFLRGRLNFYTPEGQRSDKNAGGPSVLIAYGRQNATALSGSGIAGALVVLAGARREQNLPLFAEQGAGHGQEPI
jgi:hypothetical protein